MRFASLSLAVLLMLARTDTAWAGGDAVASPEEPTWSHRPAEPRYETDFTAYTVPRHDFRISLLNLDYGLLENVQIGAAPYLYLFGLFNLHGKVTAVQTPKFDVSLSGAVMGLDATRYGGGLDRLVLTSYPITLTASWILGPRCSLHFGQRWENIRVRGAFDFATLSSAMKTATGVDFSEDFMNGLGEGGLVYGGAQIGVQQFQFGADWRFNRRDSLIVLTRSYTQLRARIDAGVENEAGTLSAGPAVKIEQPLTEFVDGVMSVSWQFTWPRFRLRVGVPLMGKKSLMTGLFQPFELYWLL
jgi:hypothetical protein